MTIVFDLDGTLCRRNTYKIFFVTTGIFYLFSFQWSALFRVFLVVLARILKGESRWEMKRKIALIYEGSLFKKVCQGIVADQIKKSIRKDLLKDYATQNDEVILATAALESYIKPIIGYLKIPTLICTTKADVESGVECLAEIKRDRIKDHLNGNQLDLFFTDHYDDIPTIKIAKKTILVKPASNSIERISAECKDCDVDYESYIN